MKELITLIFRLVGRVESLFFTRAWIFTSYRCEPKPNPPNQLG